MRHASNAQRCGGVQHTGNGLRVELSVTLVREIRAAPIADLVAVGNLRT